MGLRLVEGPDEVTPGVRFTLEVRRWGLAQRIVTEVAELDEPVRIVERQHQGPFRHWRLQRVLEDVDGDTELVETIDYETPGGLLGLVLTATAVERELAQAYLGRVERVLARIGRRDP
jgi:ligand-binding SRPBCC domain-containing protein